MLASTVQFSNNKQAPAPHHHPPRQREAVWQQAGPTRQPTQEETHPQQWTTLPLPVPSGPNSAPTTHHRSRGPFQLTPTQGSRPTPPTPTRSRRTCITPY